MHPKNAKNNFSYQGISFAVKGITADRNAIISQHIVVLFAAFILQSKYLL